MPNHKIYIRDGLTESVKQGWSWPAFFFAPLWALTKGLWLHALAFVAAVYGVLLLIFSYSDLIPAANVIPGLFTIALWFLFGVRGNKWRERRLLSKGYTLTNPEISK